MKNAARAIIQYENKYVFIKRVKKIDGNIKEYYTLVGGHLDEGETFEEACIREIYEELGVNAKITDLFLEYINEDLNKFEKFYFAEIVSGQIGTGKGEEFTNRDFEKWGSYEIVYIEKQDIKNINLLPIELKEKMINEL